MKRLLIAVAAAFAFSSPPPAAAQGQFPLSPEICHVVWDMVLVARSLALEKIDARTAELVMAHIYSGTPPELVDELRAGAIRLAYGSALEPRNLANLAGNACLRTGGDRGSMFGTRTLWRPAPRGLRT